MTGRPTCDVCGPLGFGTHQRPDEAAVWYPEFTEWLCEHCRLAKIDGPEAVWVPGTYTRGQSGFIAPGSASWLQAITPSKVAAILGVSRWESPYSVWHRMRGSLPPEEPKDEYDSGHDLEPYAANRWRRMNPGWRVSSSEVQFVLDPKRFGFPAMATLDRRVSRGRARRVVEFKRALTLSDMDLWGDDFTGDLPEDYAAQVITQMLFTGWTQHPGHLLAMGPFWNERVYEVEYDPGVAEWIIGEARRFWESLAGDEPPELDAHKATYETVRKLHPDIAGGEYVQLDVNDAVEYLSALEDEKTAKKRVQGAKTRVLAAMGDAEQAKVGATVVAQRQPHASGSVALASKKVNIQDLKGTAA